MGIAKWLSAFLVAVFALPVSAQAATWSAPVDVSRSSNSIDSPFIGFGRAGLGLAAWSWQDGIGKNARFGVRDSTRAVSGGFSPEREAPDGAPVVYGRDRVLFLSEETVTTRPRERDRIDVTFGRIGGNVGRRRRVDTAEIFRLPAVAANDAGKVAVAYVRSVHGKHRAAKLAIGSHRGFALPRIVSPSGGVNAVTTAVGPRGDVVVAWERNGRIEVRIARPGHRLGRLVRIGKGAKLGTSLRAAVAASGRVWIAWSSQMLSEGGDNGPFTLQAAISARNNSKFGGAHHLDRYDRRTLDEAAFDLALDGNDDGFIAWSTFDGQNFRARLALLGTNGGFVRSGDLSQPGYDAAVDDLATSRLTGEALVVWSRLDAVGEVGTSVLAGLRPPTGRYEGEEQVSHGDRARKPAVAFDPVTGLPTAVWSQREGPDGPGVPLANVRTFLRASTRNP